MYIIVYLVYLVAFSFSGICSWHKSWILHSRGHGHKTFSCIYGDKTNSSWKGISQSIFLHVVPLVVDTRLGADAVEVVSALPDPAQVSEVDAVVQELLLQLIFCVLLQGLVSQCGSSWWGRRIGNVRVWVCNILCERRWCWKYLSY